MGHHDNSPVCHACVCGVYMYVCASRVECFQTCLFVGSGGSSHIFRAGGVFFDVSITTKTFICHTSTRQSTDKYDTENIVWRNENEENRKSSKNSVICYYCCNSSISLIPMSVLSPKMHVCAVLRIHKVVLVLIVEGSSATAQL